MATTNDEATTYDADKKGMRRAHASWPPGDDAMYEWLALRRVHEGGATKLASHFLSRERPVADYLVKTLDVLVRTEHLALGRPDPSGAQHVRVTHSGHVKYTELNRQAMRSSSGRLMAPMKAQAAAGPCQDTVHQVCAMAFGGRTDVTTAR